MRDWKRSNRPPREQVLIDTILAEPEEPESKNRGRPFKYPTAFIFSAIILKLLFKPPYRQLEDFLISLFPKSQMPRFTVHEPAD